MVLNASGSAAASLLYAPYGAPRYSSGTMPTDYGFTGQHADAATGLDYYNARYSDPLAGQFTSADSILPANGYDVFGLSRCAYVEEIPSFARIRVGRAANRNARDDAIGRPNRLARPRERHQTRVLVLALDRVVMPILTT